MKSIKVNNESITTINKSKFICNIIKVFNEDEALVELKKIKIKYKDATHNCYAYIINNTMRFSDDGEPSGTAGMPILNVIKSQNLNNILCIVTRYFGGIKLGAGGLVRAYTNAVTNCITKSNIIEYIEGVEISINLNFSNMKSIDNILKNLDIIDKKYTNEIIYTFYVPKSNTNDLLKKLNNLCTNITINKSLWIEKKLS